MSLFKKCKGAILVLLLSGIDGTLASLAESDEKDLGPSLPGLGHGLLRISSSSTMPDQHTWELLLNAYKEVKKDTDPSDQALFEAMATHPSGFEVEYEVRQTPHKGRAVFCSEDIPKGATICHDRGARFHTEAQWREFLSLIARALARDCVDWAIVEEDDSNSDDSDDSEEGPDQYVLLDFSDASLMNHGSLEEGKAKCKVKDSGDDSLLIATRDIAAGEELLLDCTLDGVGYECRLNWVNEIEREYGVDANISQLERFV